MSLIFHAARRPAVETTEEWSEKFLKSHHAVAAHIVLLAAQRLDRLVLVASAAPQSNFKLGDNVVARVVAGLERTAFPVSIGTPQLHLKAP